MTAITTKSTLATNMTSPANMPENVLAVGQNAKPRVSTDTVTIGSNNTTQDIYLLAPFESNAVLESVKIFCDQLDTNGTPLITLDIGIANGPDKFVDNGTTYQPFAVIKATAFTSASTIGQAASNNGTEIVGSNLTASVSELVNQAWKRAGLNADPQKLLMLQVKINHVAATAATTPVVVAKIARLFA